MTRHFTMGEGAGADPSPVPSASRIKALAEAAKKATTAVSLDIQRWRPQKNRHGDTDFWQCVGGPYRDHRDDVQMLTVYGSDELAAYIALADPQTVMALVGVYRTSLAFTPGPHYDLTEKQYEAMEAWRAAIEKVEALG